MLTIPQIILISIVFILVVIAFIVSIRTTKGKDSTISLKTHLAALKLKFDSKNIINPEEERQTIEILQNKVKASCEQHEITADKELESLFENCCREIKTAADNGNAADKTSWVKLKDVMFGFDASYFPKGTQLLALK